VRAILHPEEYDNDNGKHLRNGLASLANLEMLDALLGLAWRLCFRREMIYLRSSGSQVDYLAG